MKKLLIVFLCIIVLPTVSIKAQELKLVKKSLDNFEYEHYYVLKSNKSIKQGQYYKFRGDEVIKTNLEFGQYENNLQAGTWYYFYPNGYNSIKCIGGYEKGKKNGYWIQYYEPEFESIERSLTLLLGNDNKSYVQMPKKSKEPYMLSYDTTGLQLSCFGKYEDDKKVGVWRYYTIGLRLYDDYDHTNNFLVTSIGLDQNLEALYLGGRSLFTQNMNSEFFSWYELGSQPRTDTLKYLVNVNSDNVIFERLNYRQDLRFNIFDEILAKYSDFWYKNNSDEVTNKTQVTILLKIKDKAERSFAVSYGAYKEK